MFYPFSGVAILPVREEVSMSGKAAQYIEREKAEADALRDLNEVTRSFSPGTGNAFEEQTRKWHSRRR